MPARLRWYVGAVGLAGLLAVALLLPTLDLDRVREVGGAIALFAGFVVVGELVSLRLLRDNRVKDLAVTTTFAYGLVLLTGTAVAVLVFVFASMAADLSQRKPAVKTLFNAAQCALALAAGGAVYHPLGGGDEITPPAPAPAARGGGFMGVNQ